MNLLFSHEADEYIILLINSVPISKFESFINKIIQKENWSEELCCCYFESEGENVELYRFETFEGDTYKLSYSKFSDYIQLAIIRYYLGSKSDEAKKRLEATIANTIFESSLNNIDSSLATDIPLIG